MKFIKRYKIFEASGIWSELKIIEEVEDILQVELEEKELDFNLWKGTYYPISTIGKESLIISIKDMESRFFRMEDVIDTIERLKSFLGSEYEIHLGIPKDLVYGQADEFIDDFRGEELYDLNFYIYKK